MGIINTLKDVFLNGKDIAIALSDNSPGGKALTPEEAHEVMRDSLAIMQSAMGVEVICFDTHRPTKPGTYFLALPTDVAKGVLEGLPSGITAVTVKTKGDGAVAFPNKGSAVELGVIQYALVNYEGDEDCGWQGPILPLVRKHEEVVEAVGEEAAEQ
jgi:hypothetical protein